MDITVEVDDELLEKATKYSGIEDHGELVSAALMSLVTRAVGRRLAELGGTMPDIEDIPRRQSELDPDHLDTSD